MHLVPSETHGLQAIPATAQRIYSVGISTAGTAEIAMMLDNNHRHVIATTINKDNVQYAQGVFAAQNLQNQITVKLEDVRGPLPYKDNHFDFIYARLVLHYLALDDLTVSLAELYRVLKPGGQLYAVVRSQDCPEFRSPSSIYDAKTCLTTYEAPSPYDTSVNRPVQRFFHTKATIVNFIGAAGFTVKHVLQYDEQLCIDFQRRTPARVIDNIIEMLSIKPMDSPSD